MTSIFHIEINREYGALFISENGLNLTLLLFGAGQHLQRKTYDSNIERKMRLSAQHPEYLNDFYVFIAILLSSVLVRFKEKNY